MFGRAALFRRYWVVAGAAVALALLASPAHAQLRVVTYNTTGGPRAGMDIVLRSIGEETRNGIAKPIDVLMLQEQNDVAGLPDATAFVNLLNTMYSGQTNLDMPITYARGSLVGSGDTTQSIVFRTQTVDLLAEVSIGNVGSGNTQQPRATLRHRLRLDGYSSTDAEFYVYNGHFKAGDDTDPNNPIKRNNEAVAIRNNATALENSVGGSLHAIYAGDFNLYTAGEAAFQTLTIDNGGVGVFAKDPLGLTSFDNNSSTFLNGEWHNNFASSFSHTQSPVVSSDQFYDGQIGGGMDDRFDFQLITPELDDDEGLSLIDNSYHAFGNGGGFCCNNIITTASNPVTFPGVTSHTKAQILSALSMVTDHIPVVVDYQVPAIMSAIATSVPETFNLGDVFSLDLTVSNAANVVATNGADELDYSITTLLGGAALNFSSFSQMDAALGGGNLYQIPLDTSSPGEKTDLLTIASSSQGVMNQLIQIPISYVVLAAGLAGDFNDDGVVDAVDYSVWRNHLGDPDETNISNNGDGDDVSLTDYDLWKQQYGEVAPGAGSGGLAAVPEPAGAVSMLVAMLVAACCLGGCRPGTLRAWTRAK